MNSGQHRLPRLRAAEHLYIHAEVMMPLPDGAAGSIGGQYIELEFSPACRMSCRRNAAAERMYKDSVLQVNLSY